MGLDAICLDAGGVLVDPNWHRVSAVLARAGIRVSAEALARAEPHAKRQIDVPAEIARSTDASRWIRFFELVLSHAGVPPGDAVSQALRELERYHARRNLWEQVPVDVPATLRSLRSRGVRLAVVSNANGTLRSVLERVGVAALVDVIVDSHEEGVEKPDARIFRIALERVGVPAEHAVHVGDLYHVDVVGARSAGVGAVLLDAAGLYTDVDCPRVRSVGELAERFVNPSR
jgi:HAD superfamily hydrolase (TIGR01509 family)